MANALYDAGRNAFLSGSIAWVSDTVRTFFHDNADDTISTSGDDFLDDVATAARVPAGTGAGQSSHPSLASKSASAGVADAADTTFSALTGDTSEAIIFYKSTNTDSTSALILAIDTATGLPFTPNGGDAILVYDSGANKIFKL